MVEYKPENIWRRNKGIEKMPISKPTGLGKMEVVEMSVKQSQKKKNCLYK